MGNIIEHIFGIKKDYEERVSHKNKVNIIHILIVSGITVALFFVIRFIIKIVTELQSLENTNLNTLSSSLVDNIWLIFLFFMGYTVIKTLVRELY